MKIQYYMFGILFLLLFAGCTTPKEIVYLPIFDRNMNSDSFASSVQVSEYQKLDFSGLYAIVTTDNVQINDLTYTALFKNAKVGSEVSFIGTLWTIQSLDCENQKVILTNSQYLTELKSSSLYKSSWSVSMQCDDTYLYEIKLKSQKAITATSGDFLYIPDSSPGIKVQYLQKGEFALAN